MWNKSNSAQQQITWCLIPDKEARIKHEVLQEDQNPGLWPWRLLPLQNETQVFNGGDNIDYDDDDNGG